jgi:N-acetylglucosamine kinase-like BadF-type ATPase
MLANRHRARPIAVGVDAGGTAVRIARVDAAGRLLVQTTPAVPVRALPDLLRRVWRTRGWTRQRPRALVVATRGVWTAGERRRVAREVAPLAARVAVIADAQAALLGALRDGPGLLVLSGTGSIVVGRDARGRWARAGGLGPLLGDEGSGFWLGRQWLRATVDGADPEAALRLLRQRDPVARIAALAPSVLARSRRGDRRARAIVEEGGRHLAAQALSVARTLRLRTPVQVSWAGGVMGDAVFRATVARALRRTGLAARWQAPADPPVAAAVRLALRLAGGAPGVRAGRVARTRGGGRRRPFRT